MSRWILILLVVAAIAAVLGIVLRIASWAMGLVIVVCLVGAAVAFVRRWLAKRRR